MANYNRRYDKGLLEDISNYIKEFQVENGASPSQREIASHLDTNQRRVNTYVHVLSGEGIIKLDDDGGIQLPEHLSKKNYQFVPKIGKVACGKPALATEDYEGVYRLPKEFTGTGEFFMLTAEGDSMIGANIFEGDNLVIRRQETANSGDIVVAMNTADCVHGDADATLKTFRIKDGKPILRAENDKYADIDASNYRIIGKLKCIIRDMEVS